MNIGTGIRLAPDLDALSREEIGRLRRGNFERMMAAARATPAVVERMPELVGIEHPDQLAELPVLSPADLAAGCPPYSEGLLLGGDGPGMVIRSSGTASRPKMLYHSWEFNEQICALGTRGLRALLPTPPRRVANCLSAGGLNGAFLFTQELVRLSRARTFPFGSEFPAAETARLMTDHAVDTLVAPPGYGLDVLDALPAHGPLRTFLYIGESLGAGRTRALAASHPDLAVHSLAYSTSETGCIGYQCGRLTGTAHHVHEDAVMVEIADPETGRPLPDGEEGEVLVTPLSDTGVILLRYRVGDRGRFERRPCTCGSGARVLTLLGRSRQTCNVDSTVISAEGLMARLSTLGVTDPTDCQLQVLHETNAYRLRLLLSPGAPRAVTTEAVVEALVADADFREVITRKRCLGVSVERVEPARFARTARGKVPTLHQVVAE